VWKYIPKHKKKMQSNVFGHYTATAVLPADKVEVKDIEIALAASKVIREYLNKEGIKNDEINKGMNVYVDKVYGKPFNKKKNSECNKSTYDLIPGSKEEIEKLSRTIYQG
jgi:hypothetical protein